MTVEQQPSNAEGVPAVRKHSVLSRVASADFVIAMTLLIIFACAFAGARQWPFDAKLFPMMVAGVGMVLAAVRMVLTLRPPRPTVTTVGPMVAGIELKDEDEDSDEALEYIFETASRADWLRVLSWAAGFFLAFFLVGAIPSILVFTVLYLLFEARTTWLVSAVYALLLSGMLYAARELLHILLPGGILFG
jgi:hypothetical protein